MSFFHSLFLLLVLKIRDISPAAPLTKSATNHMEFSLQRCVISGCDMVVFLLAVVALIALGYISRLGC